MSYEKHLFHRIAEEALRIAEHEDTSEIDTDDIFDMTAAVARILADRNGNRLTVLAACIAASSLGDMYELFNELPDEKQEMLDYLIAEEGYEFMESDSFSAYVRKDG
jgi:hypothetical protein